MTLHHAFLEDLQRRERNRNTLRLLRAGTCPQCNEEAIRNLSTNAWECFHCHAIFRALPSFQADSHLKPAAYRG